MANVLAIKVPKGISEPTRVWFEATTLAGGMTHELAGRFGPRLMDLARMHGEVTSEIVLSDAKRKGSVFHDWIYNCSDGVAVHRYRIRRAGEIIGRVVICEDYGGVVIRRKAFMDHTLIQESAPVVRERDVTSEEEEAPGKESPAEKGIFHKFIPVGDATDEEIAAVARRELVLWVKRYEPFGACAVAVRLVREAIEDLTPAQ